jgi:hypothetical protein
MTYDEDEVTAADVCGRDEGGPDDGIGDGGTEPANDDDDAIVVGLPFVIDNVNGGG